MNDPRIRAGERWEVDAEGIDLRRAQRAAGKFPGKTEILKNGETRTIDASA